MVNVLQAMIRTDGEQMILTPTYHVFHMYKVHHDATLLPIHLSSNTWTFEEEGTERSDAGAPVTSISATVSEKDGVINLTISNSHPESSEQVVLDFRGKEVSSIVKGSARLLTAEGFNTINTFDDPNAVAPTAYTEAQLAKGRLSLELPPHSIVVLQLK